jgi:hypothetical protein
VAAAGQLAGISGLVFAAAFVLGWLRRTVYLTELGVPLQLVEFDPLATALDALPFVLTVIPAAFAVAWIAAPLSPAGRRWSAPWRRRLIGAAGLLCLFGGLYLAASRMTSTTGGMVLSSVGFVFLAVAPPWFMQPLVERYPVAARGGSLFFVALMGTIGLGEYGAERARASSDRLIVLTESQVDGLPSHQSGTCQWVHTGLTLLYRTSGQLLVSVPGNDDIWIIPDDRVFAVQVTTSPRPAPRPDANRACAPDPPTQP